MLKTFIPYTDNPSIKMYRRGCGYSFYRWKDTHAQTQTHTCTIEDHFIILPPYTSGEIQPCSKKSRVCTQMEYEPIQMTATMSCKICECDQNICFTHIRLTMFITKGHQVKMSLTWSIMATQILLVMISKVYWYKTHNNFLFSMHCIDWH